MNHYNIILHIVCFVQTSLWNSENMVEISVKNILKLPQLFKIIELVRLLRRLIKMNSGLLQSSMNKNFIWIQN